MIRIIDENVFLGGGQVLYLRMARILTKRGYSVSLYCCHITQIMLEDFEKTGTAIHKYSKEYKCSIFGDIENQDIIITHDLYNYVLCCNYIKKHKLDCTAYLYVAHPYNLTLPFKKQFLNPQKYKCFITEAVDSGSIFFMDEQTINYTLEALGININLDKCYKNILRVPVDVSNICPLDTIKARSASRHKMFEILTIARAEFPFKGYIKGLVEIVTELKKKNQNIHLTIISSGEGIMQIKDWISAAAQAGMTDITLLTDVPNGSLTAYYEKASLYIGMGTTILEAAAQAVAAIPVACFTYQCKTMGYFHSKPEWITTEKMGEGEDAIKYIEKIIELNDEEYTACQLMTWQAVKKLYSAEAIVDTLLAKSVSKKYFESGVLLSTVSYLSKIKCYLRNKLKGR